LAALKPVGYMNGRGMLYSNVTHPHLYSSLYTLDKVNDEDAPLS